MQLSLSHCLGVNRALSRFSPLDLSPALWLDASDSSTLYDSTVGGSLVAANGTVARWEDKSGNGIHMTQGTGVSQPLRKTSVQNGLDVVRFDGANDYMAGALAMNHATEYMFFIVQKPNATGKCSLVNGHTAFNGFAWFHNFGDEAILHCGVAFLTAGAVATGAFQTISGRRASGTGTMTINGALQSITNSSAAYNQPAVFGTTIGADQGGGNNHDGDIAEVIVYPGALSDGDRTMVETYLNNKWSVY